jgi:hypothetical protein
VQCHRLDDACIGGHVRAGIEEDHVAGHELLGLENRLDALAEDARGRAGLDAEALQGALGAPLDRVTDRGVDEQNAEDGHPLGGIAGDERDDRRDGEQEDDDVAELAKHERPQRTADFADDDVRAERIAPRPRFGMGQPMAGVDAQRARHFLRRARKRNHGDARDIHNHKVRPPRHNGANAGHALVCA